MTKRQNGVTNRRDSLARARPLRGITLSRHGTAAVTVTCAGRDSDRAPLRFDPVTITPGTAQAFAEKTAEHKAKLARDPRFAALAAWTPAEVYPDPESLAADPERAELHRVACQAAIRRAEAGQVVPEAYLAWARAVCARFHPLRAPLSAGHDPRPAAVEAGLRLDPFAEEGAECDSTEKTQPRPVEQP